MKRSVILICVIFISGCGAMLPEGFDSLLDSQPRVESVVPEDGATAEADSPVEVVFSKGIEPESVDETTLAVVGLPGDAERADLVEDVVEEDEWGVEGIYEFAEEGRRVTFRPGEALEGGSTYLVIATPSILDRGLLPLNQSPGGPPTPFVSEFKVSGGAGPDPTSPGAPGGAGGEGEVVERIRPSFIVINEILYDVAGSDTDGDVFVELFGESGTDITDYEMVFINGDDGVIKDTIELPEGSMIPGDGLFVIADAVTGSPGTSDVEAADYIINFDPQNGPDCVQLLGEEGALLDSIGYGEPIVDLAENGMACYEGSLATDVSSGASLSRVDGIDLDDNSMDFQELADPTPGEL